MGHVYGYARVSTVGQSYEEQVKELKAAGCERIFSDKASGKNTNRPGFEEMSKTLLSGDTVIITKLDRLGRNLKDLIETIDGYGKDGIGFKVLENANIDTTTSQGKLVFNLFASFAQYERDLILERTAKGREAAKAKGKTGGRKKVFDNSTIKAIDAMVKDDMEVREACKKVGISRASYYRLKTEQRERPEPTRKEPKTINMGNPPFAQDGSKPKFYTIGDAVLKESGFNKVNPSGRRRAELVEVMYSQDVVVCVFDEAGRLKQYL